MIALLVILFIIRNTSISKIFKMKFAKKKITLKKQPKLKPTSLVTVTFLQNQLDNFIGKLRRVPIYFVHTQSFISTSHFTLALQQNEKKSCFCIKCQNTHLLLKEINNFGKSENLMLLFLFSN